MATLTVVVGLPGSGKSHLSEKIAQGGQPVYDDFLARHHVIDKNKGICNLLKSLGEGRDCVANEICLAHKDKRNSFCHFMNIVFGDDVKIRWEFFKKDPEQCIKNVNADTRKLDREDRIKAIKHYSEKYDIPDGATVHPVYKPSE